MYSTKRLLFRGAHPKRDGNLMTQCRNNAEWMNLMTSRPLAPNLGTDVEAFFTAKSDFAPFPVRFAICLKPTLPGLDSDPSWPDNLGPDDDYYLTAPPAIGFLGFQPQWFDIKNRVMHLSISIASPALRGQGYGSEALQFAQRYAFEELNLHKLALGVYSSNESARRVYAKAGFVEEGRLRKEYYLAGQWYDVIVMGVLQEEWLERKPKMPNVASS